MSLNYPGVVTKNLVTKSRCFLSCLVVSQKSGSSKQNKLFLSRFLKSTSRAELTHVAQVQSCAETDVDLPTAPEKAAQRPPGEVFIAGLGGTSIKIWNNFSP